MPIDSSAKAELTERLRERFGIRNSELDRSRILFGVKGIDSLTSGLPAGAITEVIGSPSSGRTSIMLSSLAVASRNDLCAVVDTSGVFDVRSAQSAGIRLENLLWARCGSDLSRALKTTELILRSGLFSFVVLDIANSSTQETRRIQQTHWLRFRRAIENTNIAFLIIAQQSLAHSLAGLVVELRCETVEFSSVFNQITNRPRPSFATLLRGLKLKAGQRRPFVLKQAVDLSVSISFADRNKGPT